MQVAIQGELGSFSHEAAGKVFPQATILPCAVSLDVFRALSQGEVDAAVIPIENSLAGSVVEHYDLLLKNDVAIESESLLRIRHNLIAVPGSSPDRIQRVYSHPVALAQCRSFFEQHPAIEAVPFYDTAGSVKQLMELRDRSAGAIASIRAAEHYGGEILAAGIEDNAENYTRFFVVRKRNDVSVSPDADKVSLAFNVENRPGTLVAALQVFADQGTNLTKIESRPVQGKPWQYVFYVDYQLSRQRRADTAIEQLRLHCSMVKELGRYRAAQRPE
ncbi:MAG TPA: prephenate dehydratase [Alloacidobacterium sp.]|jgi:prephenate dehydratase|nr:prephenate dehydratase [Alloacidobacterium sp.]